MSWHNARGPYTEPNACSKKSVGGQKGWRLPSFPELATLIASVNPGPTLPPGHPFQGIQSFYYWTATTNTETPSEAWAVDFNSGFVVVGGKSTSINVWCVRGPMQESVY